MYTHVDIYMCSCVQLTRLCMHADTYTYDAYVFVYTHTL